MNFVFRTWFSVHCVSICCYNTSSSSTMVYPLLFYAHSTRSGFCGKSWRASKYFKIDLLFSVCQCRNHCRGYHGSNTCTTSIQLVGYARCLHIHVWTRFTSLYWCKTNVYHLQLLKILLHFRLVCIGSHFWINLRVPILHLSLVFLNVSVLPIFMVCSFNEIV